MRFISNCGNTTGPDLAQENMPEYVQKALDQDFHVVVDVWIVPTEDTTKFQLSLGANSPQYPVPLELLQNEKVIARCKNLQTLQILMDNKVHCVLDSTSTQLTTQNLIWNGPGVRQIVPNTIVNMPEILTTNYAGILPSIKEGICSNYIGEIREIGKTLETNTKLSSIPEDNEDNEDDNILVLS